MRIGIIGGGVVGKAIARSYVESDEVMVFDTDPTRRTHPFNEVISYSELIFICLPTPSVAVEDGGCESLPRPADISALDELFKNLIPHQLHNNFVIRSTVPVGTTEMLRDKYWLPNIVHSPEFLTARCALVDAQIPSRNIIGVPKTTVYNRARYILNALYNRRFAGTPIYTCTSNESEATKLFLNSFFAVKVACFNEFYQYAKAMGMDWEKVHRMIVADGRLSPSHTNVPGHDGCAGFGGHCLPKDLANLINCMKSLGLPASELYPHVTKAAYERNVYIDRKQTVQHPEKE